MQFHFNGFRPGDPAISPALSEAGDCANAVDVLIVGCGPAGLTLAAQLSAFADISVRIAERKPGPLQMGQADGIACRSVEMFEAFGFAEKVMKEGYWVSEVTFWRPDPKSGQLHRADRIEDVEHDLSHMPHIILSQARIHDFYLEVMANSARRLTPDYNRQLVSVIRTEDAKYPVVATLAPSDGNGKPETIRARYVVGCDGARSTVRKAMGYELKGRAARQLWGVMDVLARTDFPDIRFKCAIQSADSGSILMIPREGGYLVRLYIEMDELSEGERTADRQVTADQIVAKARRILHPYTLDVTEMPWWSAYEIGQRVCDHFDDAPDKAADPRIFIAGDACHTHSPKAGQGMNVSMADAFNLGWKLAAVLRGQADPDLLKTYSEERQATATELIEFDKDMARLLSRRPQDDSEAALFQAYFQKHGRYTAGVATQYQPSLITMGAEHQALAAGQIVGKRFHSAMVTRLCDAKPMQLLTPMVADGRWRILLFAPADDVGAPGGDIALCCAKLSDIAGKFTGPGHDADRVIDVRAVFQQSHADLSLMALPQILRPEKGPMRLTDYEKVFCPAKTGQDIFDLRGIDRMRGAMVIVRPDQYVSAVLPLDATEAADAFFSEFLLPA